MGCSGRASPRSTCELGEGEPEESIPLLRAGEFDIALGFDFSQHPHDVGRDLERELLLEEKMWVALPPGHPLAASDGVKLSDLADEDWLCGRSGSCREHVIRLCQEAGFEPSVSFDSDDYQVLKGLVSAGLGVTLLPELALGDRAPGLELRPVSDKHTTRRVWADHPRGRLSLARDGGDGGGAGGGRQELRDRGLRGDRGLGPLCTIRCIRSAPGQRPDAAGETV